jgi:hypothetical protein
VCDGRGLRVQFRLAKVCQLQLPREGEKGSDASKGRNNKYETSTKRNIDQQIQEEEEEEKE